MDTTAPTLGFPLVEQAARPTRGSDNPRKPAQDIETEYLVCSRPAAQLNAPHTLGADHHHWGIETALHLRRDGIAAEDRSRVRNRNAASI